MPDPPTLDQFESVVFFTGAGLSAESGIATYRGANGIWEQYNYEDYACQAAFDCDPEKVWDFHEARRAHVAVRAPNAGHKVIAAIEKTGKTKAVITQNIDGLLQRAGCREPIELHGSLWRLRCSGEGHVVKNIESPLSNRKCECGAYWRPDIVWFGDMLDTNVLQAAEDALRSADCLVSVGTSALVYPAAALPKIAMETGAVSIEVNLDDTPMTSYYHYALRGTASEMLARLWPFDIEEGSP